MQREAVFRPRISRWIVGMYVAILLFLGAILIGVPLLVDVGFLPGLAFVSMFSIIAVMFAFLIAKAYDMRFIVTQGQVIVDGMFRRNVIEKSDITSIQKTPIPFGFRLFGASFLGGWYYLPGIGKAWVNMGNFDDGVLITTKHNRHYVITPSSPMEFIRAVKGGKRK